MKTIKELEKEIEERYKGIINPEVSQVYWQLKAELKTLKEVLEMIDAFEEFCKKEYPESEGYSQAQRDRIFTEELKQKIEGK